MAILTIEQRHDLWKAPLFCPAKIYSALYVRPDFRTNSNMSTCTEYLTSTCTWYIFRALGVLEYLVNCT